jgi:hypothetical protein
VVPLVDLSIVAGDPDPQPNDPNVIEAFELHVDFHESDAP